MKSSDIDFSKALTPEVIADLAYLQVAEGLGEHEASFDKWWETASEDDRKLFAEEVDAASMLILAHAPEVAAPAIDLALIVEEKEEVPLPPGFTHLRQDEGEWRELPFKGVRLKELSSAEEDGFTTMLLEMDAGSKFPSHTHHGAEHVYLLDGDLISDGRELSPGDFLRACADTDHGGLASRGGCHALIITAQQNYPKKAVRLYDRVARTVRRLVKKR